MHLSELIIWTGISWGLSSFLVESKIFSPIRTRLCQSRTLIGFFFASMLECMFCTAFWVGLIVALGWKSVCEDGWFVFNGFYSSASVYFMFKLESWLSKNKHT